MGGGRMELLNFFRKKGPKMSLHKVLKSCFLVIISLSFISCSSTQKAQQPPKESAAQKEARIKNLISDAEVACKHLFDNKNINSKEYIRCTIDMHNSYIERVQANGVLTAGQGLWLIGIVFFMSLFTR